ncbi:MAG: type II toxin-antitoxin system MqsA family antitoxin [Calditrichaceae bacterium]|nr:type II toxin-antitoxin system MqsA family antitoxin [Calditrichaceae bacterium]
MKCVICKTGKTTDNYVTVTLDRGKTVVVFKGVPAQVCANCGDYYLSEEVSSKLLVLAEKAISMGVEIEIINFKEAA